MGTDIKPIVHKISDDMNGLIEFQNNLIKDASENEQNIILQFPTVYIHNWQETEDYEVYIGESIMLFKEQSSTMIIGEMRTNGSINL